MYNMHKWMTELAEQAEARGQKDSGDPRARNCLKWLLTFLVWKSIKSLQRDADDDKENSLPVDDEIDEKSVAHTHD